MPHIITLEKGKKWYRVFWKSVHPTRFTDTPLHEPPWRFSPFVDYHTNKSVQALYMGDSAMGALAETVFRKDKVGTLLPSEVDERYLCQLSTQRPLKVAVLTDEFLQAKLGYNPIVSNDYPRCREIALLLYHLSPEPLDGLMFPSYQTDSQNANLVMFSGRVEPGDFRIVSKTKAQIYSEKYRAEFILALDVSNRLLSDALIRKLLNT